MSGEFVRSFKAGHTCGQCKSGAKGGLCASHKEIAKLAWRVWAAWARKAGVCVDCAAAAVAGTGRCPAHRAANLRRTRAWVAAHPDHNRQQWARRTKLYDQGICACPARNPVVPGGRRCVDCRARGRLTGTPAYATSPVVLRMRANRIRLASEQAKVAARTLRAMGRFGQVPHLAALR